MICRKAFTTKQFKIGMAISSAQKGKLFKTKTGERRCLSTAELRLLAESALRPLPGYHGLQDRGSASPALSGSSLTMRSQPTQLKPVRKIWPVFASLWLLAALHGSRNPDDTAGDRAARLPVRLSPTSQRAGSGHVHLRIAPGTLYLKRVWWFS